MPYHHLTPFERGKLHALVEQGKSQAFIGRALGRARSSISRELKRNDAFKKGYDPERAQKRYTRERKQCVKPSRMEHLPLWNYVFDKLSANWSPEQIAERIELEYPGDPMMRISYETIYRALYSDERLRVLIPHLRQARPKRRKRGMGKNRRGSSILNRVSIEERPKHVEERLEVGHWEGDTVIGKNQRGAIVTLVERKSLYLCARPVASKNANVVAQAIMDAMNELPARGVKTVTFDNGTEFAAHQTIANELGIAIYFAHAYASNERARNENTNGLLRQYLPKGTSFEQLDKSQIDYIVNELNNRPRKTLGYRTPHEVFHNRDVALAA
jgi:transposase, IS30 family